MFKKEDRQSKKRRHMSVWNAVIYQIVYAKLA